MKPEIWETPSTPLVYGERLVPGATRTILFYIHFDGQPVDKAGWAQADPWTPIIRAGTLEEGAEGGSRLVKPIDVPRDMARLRAIGGRRQGTDSGLCVGDGRDWRPPDTEHQGDSARRGRKAAAPRSTSSSGTTRTSCAPTCCLIVDGPQHPSGHPTIYYGARGGAGLTVSVYTAKSAMHSGNYGNWLPDANVRLAQLIGSMVGPTGKVTIDGFYDDVLPFAPAALKMMQEVPDDSESMRKLYGLGSTDGAASSLQEGLNLPAFSVHMLKGGRGRRRDRGERDRRDRAAARQENSPRQMVDRVLAHIRKQGYFIVDKDPDTAMLAAHPRIARVTTRGGAASGAWRTDPDRARSAVHHRRAAIALRQSAGARPHARRRRARRSVHRHISYADARTVARELRRQSAHRQREPQARESLERDRNAGGDYEREIVAASETPGRVHQTGDVSLRERSRFAAQALAKPAVRADVVRSWLRRHS
jgi:hypothetical protein